MPNHHRDDSLDGLIRETLRSAPVSGTECVDPETIAAWAEGALPPAEAARVEMHLSACPACQEVVAIAAKTGPAPQVAESLWGRWHLRWVVPMAVGATAAAIWIAVPEDRRTPNLEDRLGQRESDAATPVAPPAATSAPGKEADRADFADAQTRANTTSDASGRPSGRPTSDSPRALADAENRNRPVDTLAADSAVREQAKAGESAEARPAAPAEAVAPPLIAQSSPSAAAPAREQGFGRRAEAVQLRSADTVEIVSPDSLNRWRLTRPGGIQRSTDGGARWDNVNGAVTGELTAGSSPGGSVCWIVGREGVVRLTLDGLLFFPVPFPQAVDLAGVRATSADSAVVSTADGRQFRTDDRGKTWR